MRLLLLLACAGPLLAGLRAGAARVTVTPDLAPHGPVYMAGFGHNRVATGIHDDLYARCVAFSSRAKPLVICSVDSIGLFLDDTDRVRAVVAQKLGAAGPDVVVAATHVHEGPDTMGLWGPAIGQSGINEAYNRYVVERTAEAAVAAVRGLEPATARLARVESADLDGFIHDNRPPVVHDSALVVLRLVSAKGRAIATVVNWANHPETLASKNTLITADYPAALYAALEKSSGGVAVLWNGAVGGMQSPLGAKVIDPATKEPAPDSSFRKAEIIGRRVAALAASAAAAAPAVSIDGIVFCRAMARIPIANRNFHLAQQAGLYKGRKRDTGNGMTSAPVGYVRMSGRGRPVLEIALIPGELYPEVSVGPIERDPGADFPEAPAEPAVKALMSAPYRMLIGLADDEIGYIIPKSEWDEKPPYLRGAARPWYGEENSAGPDAAPRIAAAFASLVRAK